jgi:hypothetical protein
MLENENEELQRQAKEKDKTIKKIRNTSEEKDKKIKEQNKTIKEKDKTIKEQNKAIKEKDLMISKLSICACNCLESKKDCKKSSTYGYTSSEEDLKEKISKSSGIDIHQNLLTQIDPKLEPEEALIYQCKQEAENIEFDASE